MNSPNNPPNPTCYTGLADVERADLLKRLYDDWELMLYFADEEPDLLTYEHLRGFAKNVLEARAAIAAMPQQPVHSDVERLVIAAREIAFGGLFDDANEEQRAAIQKLDQASEEFATFVPWEDAPDA